MPGLIDSALAVGVLVSTSSIAVLADASAGAVVGTVLLVALVAGATGGFITWLSLGPSIVATSSERAAVAGFNSMLTLPR